jgi:hypothetical protein
VSVQIFLSYARKDELVPPDMPAGKGFVTCLREQLLFEFSQRGAPEPVIWRDKHRIERGDQFDPILKDGIESSDILLVVLSPNWMSRPWCKQELDLFKERWRHEGEMRLKQRIVVACKSNVDRDRRPSLLQGQDGYDFFAFEGPDGSGQQVDFFARGKIRDDRYYQTIEELGSFLYRCAQRLQSANEREHNPVDGPEVDPAPKRTAPKRTRPTASGNARKIYLAKPASDMREAYSRLVEEFSHSGYAIVPDPGSDIPNDTSASEFIDNALADADVSIHLLGEGQGYSPENGEPIVKLQLARAGKKLTTEGSRLSFGRIIWAPETFEDDAEARRANGKSGDGPSAQAPVTKSRLPHEVLVRFGKFQPTDKVLGGTLSKFVDFLEEHLRQSNLQGGGDAQPTGDDWVYVYHVSADTEYACDLMEALKQRGVAANLPALEGEPADLMRIHLQRLSECSAVVLCWAQATEAWAHARAHELKDWKKLGRQKKFAYRGLVAGPPPGVRKNVFVRYPPANEIDVVLNLSEDRRPLIEAIDKFVQLAPPHVQ